MARRLKCPRCGRTKYWIIRREKRRCVKCRYEWRPSRLPLRLSPLQWRRLLGWFVRSVGTAVIAEKTALHRQRVLRALTLVRKVVAAEVSPGFKESVEFERIYLGGPWKHKREAHSFEELEPRQEGAQSPSFAIFCDNEKVWIEAVSDAEGERLLPLIPKAVKSLTTEHSQGERTVSQKNVQGLTESRTESDRASEILAEKKQVNRLRGFWGYLRRQLAGRGGIRRERLPLYLAEYVWRFNSRQLTQEQQVRELLRLLKERGRPSG